MEAGGGEARAARRLLLWVQLQRPDQSRSCLTAVPFQPWWAPTVLQWGLVRVADEEIKKESSSIYVFIRANKDLAGRQT